MASRNQEVVQALSCSHEVVPTDVEGFAASPPFICCLDCSLFWEIASADDSTSLLHCSRSSNATRAHSSSARAEVAPMIAATFLLALHPPS